jgi:uncharacterized OsmC-like protein
VETEDKVLVLKRIHVAYTLDAPDAARDTVDRVHALHQKLWPVYRSIAAAIDVTTEYRLRRTGPGA